LVLGELTDDLAAGRWNGMRQFFGFAWFGVVEFVIGREKTLERNVSPVDFRPFTHEEVSQAFHR
jgi:hypothetical protein